MIGGDVAVFRELQVIKEGGKIKRSKTLLCSVKSDSMHPRRSLRVSAIPQF